ncbi:DUF6868 family protein [Aliiroseovarius sp. 2305UL8-7]|uniref:DUF6868 family protein n=1 Tax=Aliiroseovarius conchicola TaxID=3121637 RepID=UPI0035283EFB
MTLENMTSFFGWISVINIAFLLLATFGVVVMKRMAIRIHSSMFHMTDEALNAAYFTYLANFKLLTLVFGITPWLALKLMS